LKIASFREAREIGRSSQDNLYCSAQDGWAIFAIADGMGGRKGGEVASSIAIEIVRQDWVSGRTIHEGTFRRASAAIKAGEHVDGFPGMGTTLSVGVVRDRQLKVWHVGDCSVFQFRNDGVRKITRDQTEIEDLIEQGVFPRNFARKYHRKHVLTSALTADGDYKLLEYTVDVCERDFILAVTDGVTDIFSRVDLRDIRRKFFDPQGYCDYIRKYISSHGPVDDYAGIVLEV